MNRIYIPYWFCFSGEPWSIHLPIWRWGAWSIHPPPSTICGLFLKEVPYHWLAPRINDSQLWVVCPPGQMQYVEIWQYVETFLVVTIAVGGWYWHLVGRREGYAKHPTMHRIVPHNKELNGSKWECIKFEKPCSEINVIPSLTSLSDS